MINNHVQNESEKDDDDIDNVIEWIIKSHLLPNLLVCPGSWGRG